MSSILPQKLVKSALPIILFSTFVTGTILSATAATAQIPNLEENETSLPFNNSENLVVPSGQKILVNYKGADKLLVTKDETMALTLTVAADIQDSQGKLVIPKGSRILGQLQPISNGMQFLAQELVIGEDQRYSLEATSGIVTRSETLDKDSQSGEKLKNTVVSVAVGALTEVINGGSPEIPTELLGGTFLEVMNELLLGTKEVEMIAVYPNSDLHLTLLSDLSIR
ncbi:MAG: hypothetical protein WA896_06825 [Spirulinaceae cyanobacterium]